VSDGKYYSTFIPNSHGTVQLLYTKEKAPRNIRGFIRLQNLDGGSLELAMLMGVNPFRNLTPELATVRSEGSAVVRGVDTDVVTMISVTRTERDVLQFYVGKEDHLLHRFISEVQPVQSSSGGARIGDALDESVDGSLNGDPPGLGSDIDHPLEEGDTRTVVQTAPKRTRIVYDSIITPVTHTEPADFDFTPPTGAGLFMPAGSKQTMDPNSKRLADLIKKAKKNHPKPIHDVTDVHDTTNVHDVSP
jgi:hypothetical protein